MKFIIAHPGQQHSFRAATALKRSGLLYKYITTVYDRPRSWTSRLLPFLSGMNLTKARRRRCEALDDGEVVLFYELPALLIIFLSHYPWLSKIKYLWSYFVTQRFCKRVVKYAVQNHVDGIIVYDGVVKRYLDNLVKKLPNVITIMDVSIAARPWTRHVYEQDMETYNHHDFYKEDPSLWNEKVMKGIKSDISHCKYFLAASSVVKQSLIYCGIKPTQIKILPYGVDVEKFAPVKHIDKSDKLTMIFVGQINRRKGLHHLLRCVRELRDKVDVVLVGGINLALDLYKEYKDDKNITFAGFVDRDQLKAYYTHADVFVLPSLSEGMSLAGLEAMALGMPILCSDHSGINDLVEEGKNGYVFETGNLDDLKKKICWFVDNKEKCIPMGRRSREIALEHTWERYYSNFSAIINDIIKQ